MSRYACSGCGRASCGGECFTESRSDYETPQEAHKRRTAFWKALEEELAAKNPIAARDEQLTQVHGDPLLKRRVA